MGNVSILVGVQWGDEGKGKWVDILSQGADLTVRFQGGNNAGHTLNIDGKKIVLHQIPSGIFSPNTYCALSSQVVFNPVSFVDELKVVSDVIGTSFKLRLMLSGRAHVITPWSIYLDSESEKSASNPIGTTKRGIGPTYSYKASRLGLRLEDYVDDSRRKEWISGMMKDPKFASFYNDSKSLWNEFESAASVVSDFVTDAEAKIREFIYGGKKVILEGAQGTLLDIDHGSYPYVTSSSTTSLGALTSIGFSPKNVDNIYGIAKAYTTRVGRGPFPTELFDDTGKTLATLGNEFGATTGRARRCGWLDLVALKYAVEVNGLDGIILNKIDILDDFDEIKLATSYKHETLGTITSFPSSTRVLEGCTPVYETFKGWKKSSKSFTKDTIDVNMKKYISRVEEYCNCKVVAIGTGVSRQDYLWLV